MKYPRNILFCYFGISTPPCLHTHYLYPHYPHILRSVFQKKKNPRNYPWELEIVIPTILYAIFCGFPLLLPLHIHILERLIAQTLTTLNQSVKWGFSAAGKHWKKSSVGGCNWTELWDLGNLDKHGSEKSCWSKSLEGLSVSGILDLESLLLFMYPN